MLCITLPYQIKNNNRLGFHSRRGERTTPEAGDTRSEANWRHFLLTKGSTGRVEKGKDAFPLVKPYVQFPRIRLSNKLHPKAFTSYNESAFAMLINP